MNATGTISVGSGRDPQDHIAVALARHAHQVGEMRYHKRRQQDVALTVGVPPPVRT